MNPPFNGTNKGDGIYANFINGCCKLIKDQLISINPDNAVCSHPCKRPRKQFTILRNFMDEHYIEIEHIRPDMFEGAAPYGDLVIINIDLTKPHNIIYTNKRGNTCTYEKQKDIKSYFDNNLLMEFDNKIRKFIEESGDCFENHLKITKKMENYTKNYLKEMNPDKSLLYVFCIRPGALFKYAAYKKNNKHGFDKVREYYEEDQNVSAGYVNFRKDERDKAENALNYLYTKFVDLCVKFAYISDITNGNRYQIVPWLDFSKSYTDKELFNMIGMEYDEEKIDEIIKCLK